MKSIVAHPSRPTDHLHPVHHDPLLRQVSDVRKFLSAAMGDDGTLWYDIAGRLGTGSHRKRMRSEVSDVVDSCNSLGVSDVN